jgi:hypothetical protein
MSREWTVGFPEPTTFSGDDLRPMPSVASPTDEERKERDWSDLEAAARDFVKVYGVPALLRCVSRACDDQKELPL